ncbi:PAS domain S-box protein [Ideonella sp. DXS22W]|uniref:PAS domain S-box protein n=1 Tax=Pseudaquabacterium inlustre TaxID=2984192 RepID=A0ABU9CDQ4_9BURK
MKTVELPEHVEAERLAALRGMRVLDSASEPLFEHLARMASDVCGTPIALLSLVDEDRQWFKANVGLDGVTETPRHVAFCAHAIAGDALFEVPDAAQDERFHDNPLVVGEPGIRFYAGAPLVVEGGARIGTLCVIDHQARQLDARQAQALQQLARAATEALAMRRDLITRTLQAREAHVQALAESESRYRRMVEQQHDFISLARPNGRLIYANGAYRQLLARAPESMEGVSIYSMIAIADRPLVEARFARVLDGDGPIEAVNRNVAADGQVRWISWTNSLQHDEHGAPMVQSVGRDITDRRRAEAALHDSRKLLERTGRVAGVGGWQYDLRAGTVEWTAQTRLIHEVDPEFVPTLSAALAFYAPASRAAVQQAVNLAIVTGVGWDIEAQIVTAKGRPLWVRAVGEAEFEDGQAVRLVGAFQDITERKRMQARLTETTAQLNDLYDQAPCGYYSLDAQGRFIQANALTLAWLGLPADAVLGILGPLDFFSEGSRNLFRLMFPTFKAEGSMGPIEFELQGRDGTTRWVSVTASAIYDAQGHFLRSRSVMYDVTEVHQARAELHRLAAEQNAMLNNEVVGIVKLRGEQAIWQNGALGAMFGYGRDELHGQSAAVLFADAAEAQAAIDEARRALRSSGRHRAQWHLRRKDGSMIWVDASGSRLSREAGESMWVLADITQLKDYQTQVEHIAFHDALTSLPNRLLLADRLQQAVATAERSGRQVVVAYLDLDGFKAVNDEHGHEAGDRLLKKVARRLASCVRASDTVARLGGDEFVLLIAPVDTEGDWMPVLHRVIDAVRRPVMLPGRGEVSVSASVGVALYPQHGVQAGPLLACADAALYQSKRGGKNRISVFSPG